MLAPYPVSEKGDHASTVVGNKLDAGELLKDTALHEADHGQGRSKGQRSPWSTSGPFIHCWEWAERVEAGRSHGWIQMGKS